MSDSNCAICGAVNVEPQVACRLCHGSPEWQDLLQAVGFANEQFADLHAHGLLSDANFQRASETVLSMRRQWSEQARQNMKPPIDSGLLSPAHCPRCGRTAGAMQKYCATCGSPAGTRADKLRHMDFVLKLLTNPSAAEMTADNRERCVNEIRGRLEAMEAELLGEAATRPLGEAAMSGQPGRRSLAEILLDPQSIRWFLASGGVLLAVGLVIYLSSLGVLKSAMVVASAMGIGTLATLVGGIAVIRYTRHCLGGRALALLGCLVMPLNLWFYNANHLVTLDGHLWLAAMVCCTLYAAAALVLEDPLFVYVLFGGVAVTGMLVLADLHRFAEVSAPATLLMALGLIGLHAERAFGDDNGAFSRKRFGLACFRSAQALIGLGLVGLLGAQIAGWVWSFGFGTGQPGALASNRYLALALILCGAYAYLYSSLVVRQRRIYGQLAVICMLWAELLGIQIGHLTNHVAILISAMALTSLATSIAASLRSRRTTDQSKPLAGPLAPFGVGLMAAALALGFLASCRVGITGVIGLSYFAVTWRLVGAMALTAVCAQVAATLHFRSSHRLSGTYRVAAAGAMFIGAVGFLRLVGLTTWPVQATALMAIPMAYLLASRFDAEGSAKRALVTIAVAAAVALTFHSFMVDAAQWMNPMVGQTTDLWLAAFALEAAAFFVLSAAAGGGRYAVYFSAAMVCAMIYQVAGFEALPLQSCDIAIAGAGVLGLIGQRFISTETLKKSEAARASSVCANGLVSLPLAGVMLMSLSRLASGHVDFSMIWTPAALGLLALISAGLVPAGGGRRWYLSLMTGELAISLLTLSRYSHLSVPRKVEAFSVLAGLALLIVGYALWYREQNLSSSNNNAGLCLLTGALMAGLPPAIVALVNRFGYEISFVDELALMTIALLMFLTGMMSRVRATTLIGGGLLVTHLVTLVVFAGMKAQLAVGAYVAISGAALFILGLLLSIHRDRLADDAATDQAAPGTFPCAGVEVRGREEKPELSEQRPVGLPRRKRPGEGGSLGFAHLRTSVRP